MHFRSRFDGSSRHGKCIREHVAAQSRLLSQEHRFRRSAAFDVLPEETILAGSRHTSHFWVSRIYRTSPGEVLLSRFDFYSKANFEDPNQEGTGFEISLFDMFYLLSRLDFYSKVNFEDPNEEGTDFGKNKYY